MNDLDFKFAAVVKKHCQCGTFFGEPQRCDPQTGMIRCNAVLEAWKKVQQALNGENNAD